MEHRKQRLARNSIYYRVLTRIFMSFPFSEHRDNLATVALLMRVTW